MRMPVKKSDSQKQDEEGDTYEKRFRDAEASKDNHYSVKRGLRTTIRDRVGEANVHQ